MLEAGMKAVNFSLKDAEGHIHQLTDYRGKKVVLYFYPKDMTSGCTTQACAFRDVYDEYEARDIVLIGISKDDEKSHKKFIEKNDLPFLLLSDVDTEVSQAYGVWVEKSLYGNRYMGIKRSTFIIDEEGNIIKVFEKASPKENAHDILKFLNRY